MARKRRSRLKLKSAIFWIIIIVLVVGYKLLEFAGFDGDTSFIEFIDTYSEYAFEVFMWVLLGTILFIGIRYFLRLIRRFH